MRRKFLHLSIILLTCALVVAIAILLSAVSGELFAASKAQPTASRKSVIPWQHQSYHFI